MGNGQSNPGEDDEWQALDTLSNGELQQLATTLGISIEPASPLSKKSLIELIVASRNSSPKTMQIERDRLSLGTSLDQARISLGAQGLVLFRQSMSSEEIETGGTARPSFQLWFVDLS